MGVEDVIAFTKAATGEVVANHLEALSHCPVKRSELASAAQAASIEDRLHIPLDGDTLEFAA